MSIKVKELSSVRFSILAFVLQVMLLILFILFVDYDDVAAGANNTDGGVGLRYPFYQDVHVMIFVGFGFLMTFLRKYGYSSVGFNFLVAAFVIQWAILNNGFWHQIGADDGKAMHNIYLDIDSLITADFAAGAVLISMGAVLGKVSPLQLLVMAFFEVIFFAINEMIGVTQMEAVDMGGSMFVHTFGAYFGLAVSFFVSPKEAKGHKRNGAVYNSDMFAMIGTLFLWMYWPSFNGALAGGSQQHRVVINTVLALSASCMVSFLLSTLLRHDKKFDMVDIQNATLAGGVAVGTSSDLVIEPWGAILIGMAAGLLSVVGYVYIQPFLEKKFGIQDTCGVHNLHGMPGIMAGIGGTISAATASSSEYGESIVEVFPARAYRDGTSQAWAQFGTLCISFGMAVFGGIVTSFFMNQNWLCPAPANIFHDKDHWEVAPYYIQDEEDDESFLLPISKKNQTAPEMAHTTPDEVEHERVEMH
eukprot:Nk52_evm38s208 gene=Nk52_evmTU38s208